MGRDATKAAGNPWYQARKKAAEYDDRLCSRESAAEQLGMSVSSLADAELGNTKFMPVDKAVLMADRYNAPWLLNHYCLNECPIGCRHSLSDEVVGIDRVTVKLLKSLKTEKLGDVKDTLLDIAADGKITEDEKPALQEVLAYSCDCCGKDVSFPFDSEDIDSKAHRKELRERLGWITTKVDGEWHDFCCEACRNKYIRDTTK